MTPHRLLISALLVVGLLASGCGDSPEDIAERQKRAEQGAVIMRAEVDAFARAIGTAPETQQDTLQFCELFIESSGLSLSYILHVKIDPGTLDRVKTDVAEEWEKEGWAVEQLSNGIQLQRGHAAMIAFVYEDIGRASVLGSTGCFK